MSRNYYLHRISHHAEATHPLLKRGLLPVDVPNLTFGKYAIKFFKHFGDSDKIYEDMFGDWEYFTHRFLYDMKRRDWILVPDYPRPTTFSIVEIKSHERLSVEKIEKDIEELREQQGIPYKVEKNRLILERNGKKSQLIFFRKVTVLHEGISVQDYADSGLVRSLRFRGTNADISNREDSIKRAVRLFSGKVIKKPLPKGG